MSKYLKRHLYENNKITWARVLITQIYILFHNRTQQLVTKACISMQKNRECRPSWAPQMQPLFMTGDVILSSIPRRGGASRGRMRAMRGHQLNPVPPPPLHHPPPTTTAVTKHQPHPCAINTDVHTLNTAESEGESVPASCSYSTDTHYYTTLGLRRGRAHTQAHMWLLRCLFGVEDWIVKHRCSSLG